MAREVPDVVAILLDRSLPDARLAAVIEHHGHALADATDELPDDVHLGIIRIDVERPPEFLKQIDAFDELIAQGQGARIGVELHDPADSFHAWVGVSHPPEHRFNTAAPFHWRHGHNP